MASQSPELPVDWQQLFIALEHRYNALDDKYTKLMDRVDQALQNQKAHTDTIT